MKAFRRIMMNYKLAERLKESGKDDSQRSPKKAVSVILAFLYACLCILGFRFFLLYDMHIVWKFLLVNVSVLWGILSIRIFMSIFKNKQKQ